MRLWVLGLLMTGLVSAQETLQVTGAVKAALTLSADDLARMPRASVKLGETVYGGVWLHEILKNAGVPQGEQLRGKALAGYILAKAQDGYEVVFSIAETDPSFIDNQMLVADRANGKPLPAGQGPFRLVVPRDKPAARSVRMLTVLEVVQPGKPRQ